MLGRSLLVGLSAGAVTLSAALDASASEWAAASAQGATDHGWVVLVGTEDCCATHVTAGCFVPAVQECVCNLADRCCLSEWTEDCVALAANTCGGCFGASFLATSVAARNRQGVTGYCSFNGGRQAGAAGLLVGLFGAGGWLARSRRRR